MLKRIPLVILLAIQALGGGAITLAHARDVAAAPPGVEATHEHCAILHDELRCALCHYAGARVVVQHAAPFIPAGPVALVQSVATQRVFAIASAVHLTAPTRAPIAAPWASTGSRSRSP